MGKMWKKSQENNCKNWEGLTLSDIKIYCKAFVNKTVWYRFILKQIYKWNIIKNPEIEPNTDGNLV